MNLKITKAHQQEKLSSLIQPGSTRWGSMKACFESVFKSESVLHNIVSARDFIQETAKQKESRKYVLDIVTSFDFVSNLTKSIAILNPIDATIVAFQSDIASLSKVSHSLSIQLTQCFEKLPLITTEERSYFLKVVKSRADFLYGDAIGMTYLLDLLFIGDGMESCQREEME